MSSTSEKPKPSLANLAVKNTFWAYMSFVFGKGLTFVTTLILARLLTPADYGVVGYCLIALQYLDLLNNIGVGYALVARRDKFEEAANAAFGIGLLMSLLMYAISWFGAPWLADFFHEPQVTDLFRTISLVLLISAFGTVPGAILQRELRFKARLFPNIASTFLKGGVSIVLALNGYGVWSLVIGQIAGQITDTSITWLLVRWFPSRAFDRQVTKELLRFGVNVTFNGFLGSFMTNVDYLLVGRILGNQALGLYTMAYRMPELIIRNTNFIVDKVAFPLLAQLQTDATRLRSVYFAYVRYVASFTIPAGVGLALIAGPFVRTFLKADWEPMIVPMQLVSLAIGMSIVSRTPGTIYNAINRPEILSRLSLVKLPFVLTVLWLGTRWGITGVAAGHIVLTLASMVLDTVIISRIVQFPALETVRVLMPAVLGAIAIWVVGSAVALVLPPKGFLTLAVLAIVGIGVYAGVMAIVSRETLVKATSALRGSFARS